MNTPKERKEYFRGSNYDPSRRVIIVGKENMMYDTSTDVNINNAELMENLIDNIECAFTSYPTGENAKSIRMCRNLCKDFLAETSNALD